MALTHNQYAVAAIAATLILAGFYTIIGAGLATVSGWEDGSVDIETSDDEIHIEGKDTDGDGYQIEWSRHFTVLIGDCLIQIMMV